MGKLPFEAAIRYLELQIKDALESKLHLYPFPYFALLSIVRVQAILHTSEILFLRLTSPLT